MARQDCRIRGTSGLAGTDRSADGARPAPEIHFPRVEGYRVTFPKGRLKATFTEDSRYHIGADVPIPKETEVDPLVGMQNVLDLSELDAVRAQTIAYMLARRALEKWARMVENQEGEPLFLFPQFLTVARRWLAQTESFTKGDQILTTKLRNMTKDAMADPVTAAQMPYSKNDLIFLGKIFENLTAP